MSKLNHTNIIASFKRLGSLETAKGEATKKVTAAYELIAECINEAATAEGIKTGTQTDAWLASVKIELVDASGGEADVAFQRRWERAVKAAFAEKDTPLVVSAKRKADQAKTKASHFKQAADRLEKAGVEQPAAKKAVLAAIASDTTGVLTLNLLKVVEAFNNGVLVVRVAPKTVEAASTEGKIATKVVGKIAPAKAAPKRKAA